jgi:PKD repeat protein
VVQPNRITNVAWDWGDGATSTTATTIGTHSFLVAGTYDVSAVVTISGVTGTASGSATAVVQ